MKGLYKIFSRGYRAALTGDGDATHTIRGGSLVVFNVQSDGKGLRNTQAQFVIVILKQSKFLRRQTEFQNSGFVLANLARFKDGVVEGLCVVSVAREKGSDIMLG
jgi:hypothetical protein